MSYGDAIIVDRLRAAELESTHSVVHDAEFGVRLLYQDPHSERNTTWFGTRPASVLAYTVTRPLTRSFSSPCGRRRLLFVTIFDGPYDIEALD